MMATKEASFSDISPFYRTCPNKHGIIYLSFFFSFLLITFGYERIRNGIQVCHFTFMMSGSHYSVRGVIFADVVERP